MKRIIRIILLKYKYYIKTKFMNDVYYFPIRGLIKDKEKKYISFYCCGCLDIHDDYPIKDVKYIGNGYWMCKESFDKLYENYFVKRNVDDE